jgi:predicted transposase YdaD
LKRLSDNQLILQGQFEKGVQVGEHRGMEKGMEIGEHRGMEKGKREGLLSGIKLVLKIKFGEAGERLFDELAQCEDIARLEAVQHILETATTVDVVRQVYEQEKHPS